MNKAILIALIMAMVTVAGCSSKAPVVEEVIVIPVDNSERG
jgi:outer membrane murein-binding lipoprotein Lpp